ncbi:MULTISPECIES: fused MFS/spermidine synthase [Paraburkholderia]|uniref:fused MFS/spermidine synthase n=1 Tax=Paraburkholderia TaxID=1822464 RepID=UPI00224EA854|nr:MULTISPECIES: fused MFS/spermidine synthase [Paraburkholderia]MCX4174164.1 fused MFS/spermidine synthase [Paraburkholderia madseniana]MDQ6462167.1 fused MFS/spermidine synthase [Paraburkholderia madseniana]
MGLSADHNNQLRHALAEHWGKTFGKPVVREGLRTRSLCFDAFGIQSSMRKSAPLELDLSYTRAMMSFQLFRPDPRDILIVGLGGGSLSKYCFHKFPSTRVTTVEIDGRVIALREWFAIPPESERFRIVHADAAEYLSDRIGVADVILLDGFDAFGLPASLSSQSFYDACHTALRSEGVLVANLLNNDPRLATHLDRLRRACDGKLFRTMARGEGNTIAIGIKQETVPGWLDLYARAEAITKSMGLDLYRYVKKMERHHRTEPVPGCPSSNTLTVEQDV